MDFDESVGAIAALEGDAVDVFIWGADERSRLGHPSPRLRHGQERELATSIWGAGRGFLPAAAPNTGRCFPR